METPNFKWNIGDVLFNNISYEIVEITKYMRDGRPFCEYIFWYACRDIIRNRDKEGLQDIMESEMFEYLGNINNMSNEEIMSKRKEMINITRNGK